MRSTTVRDELAAFLTANIPLGPASEIVEIESHVLPVKETELENVQTVKIFVYPMSRQSARVERGAFARRVTIRVAYRSRVQRSTDVARRVYEDAFVDYAETVDELIENQFTSTSVILLGSIDARDTVIRDLYAEQRIAVAMTDFEFVEIE